MRTTTLVITLTFLAGCEEGSATRNLRNEVAALRQENDTLRKSQPAEQPAVLKELSDAKQTIGVLQAEVSSMKESLEKANAKVPREILPLAELVLDLKARVANLENTASRKGHTHQYEDSCPVGTVNTRTKTTDPDK